MSFNKLLIAIVCLAPIRALPQITTVDHYVTNNVLGTSTSIDYFINLINSTSSAGITYNIYLSVSSSLGYIQLTQDLPSISVANACVVNILPDPSYSNQGFDMTYYNVAPSGGSWPGPGPGLTISNCNIGSKVTISNLVFYNFNKVLNTYMNGPNGSNSYFIPSRDYHCGGGPPCIAVGACDQVEIKNCVFTNYATGISYNETRTMNIHDNTFYTDADYGCGTSNVNTANAIVYRDASSNLFTNTSTIIHNSITGVQQNGIGIIIDPASTFGFYGTIPDQSALNTPAKVNMTIQQNTIKNCGYGVVQSYSFPKRTTPDASYQLLINSATNSTSDQNVFENSYANIVLGQPYKHFKVDYNSFTLKPDFSPLDILFEIPCYLALGSYTPVPNLSPIPGGQLVHAQMPFNNAYGFDMINVPNNAGYTTANNNHNTFNFIPYTTSCPFDPIIYTVGDFGDNGSTNSSKPGVNFVGLNFQGSFLVDGGKNTSIRECTNTLDGRCDPNGNYPMEYVPPIDLSSSVFTDGNSTTPVYGNQHLQSPSLVDASIQNGNLNISLALNGSQINNQNGHYVLEFFKSNIKGELVQFIQNQNVNTLTGTLYQYTNIVPVTGVVLNPGDRIAVTLTSIGDNVSSPPQPVGTSTPSYIYTLPPCSDCVSDFAPIPGKSYLISCWVSSDVPDHGTYADNPNPISVIFTSYATTIPLVQAGTPPVTLVPSGPMIDGWQKIEGIVTVDPGAVAVKLEIDRKGQSWYVDDFRFHPADATAKTYAYDPYTLRLSAELDEQNFATFYEYDEEGKLTRVKKETERGVMTIKESKNSKPFRQ